MSLDLSGLSLDMGSLPAFDGSSIAIDPSSIDAEQPGRFQRHQSWTWAMCN